MAFCMNCGKQLPDGAKFCDGCGTAIGQVSNQHNRQFEFEGTIHKCPNCGDIIDAYESVCEACGYEIRDRKASNSICELATKIQEIERTRVRTEQNPLKTLYFGQSITDTDNKIVSLISSFPIPNSKEDLYEFIVLSHSNINIDVYNTGGNQFKENDARLVISNAWKAKLEQAYQKAKLVFAGDRRMDEIQAMYDSIHKSIKKAKSKSWKFVGVLYAILIGFFAIVFILASTTSSSKEKKELARLEAIILEVQDALAQKEYKLALNIADSIDYQRYDVAMERKWDIQREYWVDKVIEEAVKEGIVLEYTPTLDIDNANDKPDNSDDNKPTVSKETIEQFTNGYNNAVFDDYNSPASENGLAGSRIYIYCTLDKTEILEANGTTSILGYVTDKTNNEWLIQLHFVPAVSKTAFDTYVGKELILRGVYSGFSGTKKMPVVVLDEMIVFATGENVIGMQKLLDE